MWHWNTDRWRHPRLLRLLKHLRLIKSNLLTFECTFATTMNKTNIKTHYNDAGTTQAAKRARTAEEQDNTTQQHSSMDMDTIIPLSDITNDMFVRPINAAATSENHLEEEEEQEHDNEHHDNTNAAGDIIIQFDPIKYKDQKWTLPPLRKVKSTKNALEHLKTKLHYNENHAKARDKTEKNRLNNIHGILKGFLLANFSKVQSSIKLKSMIQDDEGVYIGYYSPDRPPKFGFAW